MLHESCPLPPWLIFDVSQKMHSTLERVLVGMKWLASFLSARWELTDYPIRVRQNGERPPVGQEWMAQILKWPGPIGVGTTREGTIEALRKNLESIREVRISRGEEMPRPGAEVPITFADTTRIDASSDLLDDFLFRILGFAPDAPVFVSDESSLGDFGDEVYVAGLQSKIRDVYGVDVSDLKDGLLCDIFDRIRTKG